MFILLVLCTTLIAWRVYGLFFAGAKARLPPAPKPLPIIGNVLDLPPSGMPEFRHWLKHREAYGSISSITILGQTLILIHDKQAAIDLLDKRPTTTAGRPTLTFATMCKFDEFLFCQQYDEKFRRGRRFVDHQLGTKTRVDRFEKAQEIEVRRFLSRTLQQPDKIHHHLHTMAGAIILRMTYGYSIKPEQPDPLVDLSERMTANLSQATVPLAWLVDAIPFMRYLPDSFPGMAFKKTAQKWAKINEDVVEIPYSFVKRQMRTGVYPESYVSELIQQRTQTPSQGGELNREDENAIKWTAATLYAAGSETTASNLSSFILAMVLFPEVQQRAQDELDQVVGNSRLPQLSNREKLPYIEGVVRETFRWSPIGPLGFAHITSESTVYNGYRIPKGAALIPSIYWFLHNPDYYTDPESFSPERYTEPRNEPDPTTVVFGFGRRICPGRYLTDATVFLTVAYTLACFNVTKAVDAYGNEMEAKLETIPGITNKVKHFSYSISPRSPQHAALIRSIEVEHPPGEGDASLLREIVA